MPDTQGACVRVISERRTCALRPVGRALDDHLAEEEPVVGAESLGRGEVVVPLPEREAQRLEVIETARLGDGQLPDRLNGRPYLDHVHEHSNVLERRLRVGAAEQRHDLGRSLEDHAIDALAAILVAVLLRFPP